MPQNQSPLHNRLVENLIYELGQRRNHRILAASHQSYDEPSKCGRHEPDVISVDATGLHCIAEAKIGEDLYTEHTHEQFVDFSNRVMKADSRPVPFVVLVPKPYENKLREVLNSLGLLNKPNVFIWTS